MVGLIKRILKIGIGIHELVKEMSQKHTDEAKSVPLLRGHLSPNS